jgi:multicomponent Na+:H+ antiporter subunit D
MVVISLLQEVLAGGRPTLSLTEVMPGLPLVLEIEPLGMLFGCVASGLWIINSLYSIGYMRGHDDPNQTRFYLFFAIAIARILFDLFQESLVIFLIGIRLVSSEKFHSKLGIFSPLQLFQELNFLFR